MNKFYSLLFLIFGALGLAGCAALPSILTTIDHAVTDADQALQLIETTFDVFQTEHPVSPADRATFEKLLATAYGTLKAGAALEHDAKSVSQGNYDQAFADFKVAFQAIKDYMKAHQISPIGEGMIGASQADVDGFPVPAVIGLRVQ
jgi:hypothetical protein